MLLATLIGFSKKKHLDKASKVILKLLSFTFIAELLTLWAKYAFKQNNPIYNVSTVAIYVYSCLYFGRVIPSFKKKSIGKKLAIFGVVFAILNTIFFQGIFEVNSFFLAFQSITMVGCSLYYFYEFLSGDTYTNKLPIHFWFTALFLIFWSFTFFYWLIAYALMYANAKNFSWLSWILFSFNIIYYGGFTIIFLFYKKLSANE